MNELSRRPSHSTVTGLIFAALTLGVGCDSSNQPAPAAGSAGQEGVGGGGGKANGSDATTHAPNFFVTSDTSKTGNLGGLAGADARCDKLAKAAGFTQTTWHAYLSTEHGGSGDGPVNARDRIGTGPWYNANGILVATDLAALHSRFGDAEVFVDEHGDKIPGQWAGSPQPVEHDILTGSNADGTVMAAMTCADWTSEEAGVAAQCGHSDGLGPGMSASPPFNSWNSSHANQGCNDTAPRGGAGRIYCFAVD